MKYVSPNRLGKMLGTSRTDGLGTPTDEDLMFNFYTQISIRTSFFTPHIKVLRSYRKQPLVAYLSQSIHRDSKNVMCCLGDIDPRYERTEDF